MVLGLDLAALSHAFHALRPTTTGAVQGDPATAPFEPAPDGPALGGIGVGPGHVGDQEPAHRQPLLDIREVVAHGGRDIPLGQEPQQSEAGIVVVVPGAGSGRETAGNEVRTAGHSLRHVITSRALRGLVTALSLSGAPAILGPP